MREMGHVFAVVSRDELMAQGLKEMIEFLDVLPVQISEPQTWLQDLGDSRPVAMFVGGDLDGSDVEKVVAGVAELDANTPIVLFSDDAGAAGAAVRAKYAWVNLFEQSTPISFDELSGVLDEAWSLRRRNRRPEPDKQSASGLVGASRELDAIRKLVEQVAPTGSTVLLNGESGTGKEVVARRIHELSGRKGRFVAVNCGAIPDHLLETELFGHERGAFTGAETARTGRFEWADGGTLFLDEIGDMPKALQVKLLRVLQERVIERIGANEGTPVDIRLVAATHRDLPKWIEEGKFREDLFYRLSVFPIDIPPLRDRKDDIQPLVEEFVDRVRQTYGANLKISSDAMECLKHYDWPGNVRELANLIERLAVIDGDRVVEACDLPRPVRPAGVNDSSAASGDLPRLPEGGINLKNYLSGVERQAIASALTESNGVVQAAADKLGLGRTTLVEKIRRYGIET
jgi:sigma-54 specific flagellar transcriptional regulator A